MGVLRLIVLSSPLPQPQTEFRLEAGHAVLGREPGCDWCLVDPEQFVSRRHCLIASAGEGWTITDTSSGGLFLDLATEPLGQGQSAALRDGMRLRLGDVLLGVEFLAAEDPASPAPAIGEPAMGLDPFFAPHAAPAEPPPRPTELPEPFERITGRDAPEPVEVERASPPADFDDPFTLDPVSTHLEALESASDDWGWGPTPVAIPATVPPSPAAVNPADPTPAGPEARPPPPPSDPPARQAVEAAEAFLQGAGLEISGAENLDLEAIGRRYRMLAEGLVALLRIRASEKGSLGVARTTLGPAEVNPLKFLVIAEEQVQALIAHRGAGYLDPDAAIAESFRDLADHHMRSWQGLQSALRQMIDRFSPEAIEAELAEAGTLRKLMAGGKSALLWDAYAERWNQIARAAEDRFLGEAGADFRNAYEISNKEET